MQLVDCISNAKILIVDDNPANVMLLEKLLKISGYNNIKTTTDSRKTFALYTEFKPDLLLLDFRMPYLDGFQVMEQLNSYKEDDYLPIVMITAQDDREHRLKALKTGAKDFIAKPFDNTEVIMRIRNILEIRLLYNKVRFNNHQLEEKVQERIKEFQELQIELIQRLVLAAEFRDSETGNHIVRMSMYTYELGKVVDLSEKECKLLGYASMMHDIGKIGIPDDILLKPGKLIPKEWEIMKTHAHKGALILNGSSSEIIKMAEQIALTHHEKWDGSGYPQGLKGEEIPLVGRITAICDVFDALFSERPYKQAWPKEMVISEMKRGSGSHFDPFLVEAFINILPTIYKIKDKYI